MKDEHHLLNSYWQWPITKDRHHGLGCINQDMTFDRDKMRSFLKDTQFSGMNGVRLFSASGHNCNNIKRFFGPCELVGNKWDEKKFNDYYFEVMHQIIKDAKILNLNIWIAIFDDCSLNDNGSVGDEAQYTSFGLNSIYNPGRHRKGIWAFPWEVVKKYYQKFITEFKDYDNVYFALANEGRPRAGMTKSVNRAIQIVNLFFKAGINPQRISWGCQSLKYEVGNDFKYDHKKDFAKQVVEAGSRKYGRTKAEHWSELIYREFHTAGEMVKNRENGPGGFFTRWALYRAGGDRTGMLFLSTDGTKNKGLPGVCDYIKEPGLAYARPAAETIKVLGKMVFKSYKNKKTKYGDVKICVIENLPENPNNPKCWKKNCEALSGAYRSVFGKWPENYHKELNFDDPAPPVPGPQPPFPGPTPNKEGWLLRLIRFFNEFFGGNK